MTPENKIAIAVVGLGYWGPNLARNISSSPKFELRRLCDRDVDRTAAISGRYPQAIVSAEFDEVIDDDEIDAVAIATPVSTHYDLVRQALEAGKHVIVEKPLATSVVQAQELLDIANERGLTLLVDHVFVYSPAVRKLIDIAMSGEIGDITFIDSVRINLGLIQNDVNVLWDLAPHDLSIIDALLGQAPDSVVAVGASHVANGNVDVSYLHLDYGGITAAVHLNWLSPVKIRHLMIGGTKKSLLYNDLDRSEPVKVYDSGVNVADDPRSKRGLMVSYRSGDVLSPRIESYEPLSSMINHFYECITQNAKARSGGEQGLRVVRILEAADRSLSAGGARIGI